MRFMAFIVLELCRRSCGRVRVEKRRGRMRKGEGWRWMSNARKYAMRLRHASESERKRNKQSKQN
jgi:hypothetical protein